MIDSDFERYAQNFTENAKNKEAAEAAQKDSVQAQTSEAEGQAVSVPTEAEIFEMYNTLNRVAASYGYVIAGINLAPADPQTATLEEAYIEQTSKEAESEGEIQPLD